MQTGLSPPSRPLPTPRAMADPGGPRPAGGAAGRACGRRAGLWRCWAAHTEGSVRGRAPGQGRGPGRLTWRAGRTQQRRSQLRPTLPTCMDVGWRVCPRASLVLWPDPWGPSRPALQPPASVGSRARPRAPAPLDIPPTFFLARAGQAGHWTPEFGAFRCPAWSPRATSSSTKAGSPVVSPHSAGAGFGVREEKVFAFRSSRLSVPAPGREGIPTAWLSPQTGAGPRPNLPTVTGSLQTQPFLLSRGLVEAVS